MEDFNQKATKEIADMIQYVANEAVDNAGYDKTRNARVTQVYYADYPPTIISGYDVSVDGRSYNISKERGKGVIAKVNDVVKLHFPCDNSNLMYISYPHDPEDFIVKYSGTQYGHIWQYNNGVQEIYFGVRGNQYFDFIFPATTKQFSKTTIAFGCEEIGISTNWLDRYSYTVACDNGVFGTVTANVGSDFVVVNLYNENPDTVKPVVKQVTVQVLARTRL